MITLTHGQLVLINGASFHAGSVRGYAAQYNEDQDFAADRATKNGHDHHWLSRDCSVLCSDRGYYERRDAERAAAAKLAFGDLIEFEGKRFQVQSAPNGNAALQRVA